MSTLLKKLAIVALIASIAPTLAMARVKPLHEYKAGIKQNKAEATCEGQGHLSSPVSCAICNTVTISGGTTCYDCTNDTTQYPFEDGDCNKTGLKVTASCTVNGETHQMCACDESAGYYEQDKFIRDRNSFNEPSMVAVSRNSKEILCLPKTGWTCNTGTLIQNLANLSDGFNWTGSNTIQFISSKNNALKSAIRYTATTNVTKDSSIPPTACITQTSGAEGLLYTKDPKSTCVETKTHTAALTGVTFYYHSGCKIGGECISNPGICGSAKPIEVKGWNGSSQVTLTCKVATGCNVGKVESGFCYGLTSASAKVYNSSGAASASYSGGVIGSKFAATTETVGNYTCVKITGCADGYSASTNSITDTNLSTVYSANASDTTTLYDAAIAYHYSQCFTPTSCSNTTDRMICRKPIGCKLDSGYYDTTCDTGCWDGYLSWFMPQ